MTGGGTGGHITPILAVAHELKALQPDCITIYVGERGSKFTELTKNHPAIEEVYAISAGKLRRYHGESWLRRLADVKTNVLNLRDGFKVAKGVWEALRLLRRTKPDIVFLKGGFVGVPVGLAAAFLHLPIVTHDSDALPGLANRLVSRWASLHATALPAKYYPYPENKVRPVGVLVEHSYVPVDAKLQLKYKQELGLPGDSVILLTTGGSSGAQRINKVMVKIADGLLHDNEKLYIIHQAGKGKSDVYGTYKHARLQVLEFLSPMYVYMGAADVVIARASGNTIAELGTQGKACIVIPNPDLTGGHQLKNAERLEEQGAAIVVQESQLYESQQELLSVLKQLLDDKEVRDVLGGKLQNITIKNAAKNLAILIIETAK